MAARDYGGDNDGDARGGAADDANEHGVGDDGTTLTTKTPAMARIMVPATAIICRHNAMHLAAEATAIHDRLICNKRPWSYQTTDELSLPVAP